MSAALAAAAPNHNHATTKPPKKTLRSSLQDTFRNAAGHVRHTVSSNNNKDRDRVVSQSTTSGELGVLGPSQVSAATTPTGDRNHSIAPALTRTIRNDNDASMTANAPRPPSRTANVSPAPSSPPDTPCKNNEENRTTTTRTGGIFKLLTAKPKFTSANLLTDDRTKRDRDPTFRPGAFQPRTLRSGTLSDPALHTLARREKHQPLLSLAAAFDPQATSRASSAVVANDDPTSPSRSRAEVSSSASKASPKTPTPTPRPINASTTSLTPSTRERSHSRSRPPTTTPSSPSQLHAKRPPPVSGISRSRITSPPLVQSVATDSVPAVGTQNKATGTAAAVAPPTIRKRSSIRASTENGKLALTQPPNPPTSRDTGATTVAGKTDTGTITGRKRSSSVTPASSTATSSPTTRIIPSSSSTSIAKPSPSNVSATAKSRPNLTSASTSNLPHISSLSSSPPTASASSKNLPPPPSTPTPTRRRASNAAPTSMSGANGGVARTKSPTPTAGGSPPVKAKVERERSITPTPSSRAMSPSRSTSPAACATPLSIRDRGHDWGRATPSPSPGTPSPPPRRASQATTAHARVGVGTSPVSGSLVTARSQTPLPTSPPTIHSNNATGTETGMTPRDAIRQATTFILREATSPPRELLSSSAVFGSQWTEEMNRRTKMLAKSAKTWTQAHGDVTRAHKHSEVDEEKERKAFCDALRDGYVLCQLLNKWRSNIVSAIDHREDGISKSSNIAHFALAARKFLEEHSLSDDVDMFMCSRDDFVACTVSSMLRVAKVILALALVVDSGGIKSGSGRSANPTPSPPSSPPRHPARPRASIVTPPSSPSKLDQEHPNVPTSSPATSTGNPVWLDTGRTKVWAGSAAQQAALRGTLSGKRRGAASASTPNLLLFPPTSSAALTAAGSNNVDAKRESPTPPVIPILTGRRGSAGASPKGLMSGSMSVTMSPSSSSPTPATHATASVPANKHVSLPPASPGSQPSPARSPSSRMPPTTPPVAANRSSVASTATSATTTSATDSLFDSPTSAGGYGARTRWDKFGSVRTNVTNLTGITIPSSGGIPSLSRSEARDAVKEMAERDVFGEEKWTTAARMTNNSNDTVHNLSVPSTNGRRDHRSSELATDLVRVVEEDDETMLNQKARHLRRLVIPPGRNSRSHTPSSRVEHDDVFTIDDDVQLTPPKTNSREQGRAYSPSYLSRSLMKQDKLTGGNREASPSPARVGGTSGLSSSPSRRQSGRLVPKGSSSANNSGHLSPRNRGSGELGFIGNDSTSSLVESPAGASQLLPTPHGSSPVPIPFPQGKLSSDIVKPGGKAPLGRAYNVSASPTKASGVDPRPANARPTLPRSRILSDTTAISGEASLRLHLDRALSDGANDFKAGRRARFESMVDVSTSANMREGNLGEGGLGMPAMRRTLVIKEPGQPAVHYQLGNCIGRGQFGSVYRALNMTTGQVVAVKQIRLEGLSESEVKQLMQEVELLKRLDHPSIVKYEGMSRDADALNIVLEYVENGSLGQTLRAFGRLNEKLVAGYVAKILEGLHYLHQSQVVHCDMKAANILTTKNGNVKLSDFGVSLNLRAMEHIKKDVAGTPNWMAPEVIELKGASTASDIWSLGCTIIELLTGKPPYADNSNGLSVMFHIVEDAAPPLPPGRSDALSDFFSQCFQKDPTKRPSAEELFEHPWLKDTWVELKDLRPIDSVPFLRRVSTNLQNRQSLVHQISFTQPPPTKGSTVDADSQPPTETNALSRHHTFVKTSFGQPVDCRVCWAAVRKSAQFCPSCFLICHSRCIADAPSICDAEQQVRANAEHTQRQGAISPTLEPRGRKVSVAKRASGPASGGAQVPSSPASPPTSFITAWRKSRNSTSISDGAALSSSAPTTPRAGGDHAREPSSESSSTQNAGGDSLRSSRTASSSANTGRSSSILRSYVGSNGSRIGRSGEAMATSIEISSSQASSVVDENSLPRNTPAPDEPKPTGTQSNRLKRKPKGTDSGTSCVMQ